MKISCVKANIGFLYPGNKKGSVGFASNTAVSNLPSGGIYVKPVASSKMQQDTVKLALSELKSLNFSQNDILYMQNLGLKLPFKSGKEITDFIDKNNIEVRYASFSNPNIHACLDYKPSKTTLLVNANYEGMARFPDVLAISEALAHEAGHAKDKDSDNSIQEELECLALNVVVHQAYKNKYEGIFNNEKSFLFAEGVNLYNNVFYDFDFSKDALKKRVAIKYGYLNSGDSKHPASPLADEIKQIALQDLNRSAGA